LFERERIMLAKTEVTRGVVGRYVETYAYSCGRLNVRWKRYSLLYKVFDRTRSQRKQHRLKLRLKVHCDSLIFQRSADSRRSAEHPQVCEWQAAVRHRPL
jgi:hypothetical protein